MDTSISAEAFAHLNPNSKDCITRLHRYLETLEPVDLSKYPEAKLAAVLVLVYEEKGVLRVLLTTRSKQLRTHAGQTALPGGKKDLSDINLIATALREAQEEVGLPLSCPNLYVLGQLSPFISLHRLFVTPVVAFLSTPAVLDKLKASEHEVAQIFSHPLGAILDPDLAKAEPLVPKGSEDWPYKTEIYNTSDSVVPMLKNTSYRMHRFRTSASPIKGLTADILIKTAEIAYAEPTTYERFAPDQLRTSEETIEAIMSFEASST